MFVHQASSPWMLLLIFLGPVGHLAMALLPKSERTRRLILPICADHAKAPEEKQRLTRRLVILLIFLIIVYVIVGRFVERALPDSWVVIVTLLAVFALVIAFISRNRIRCTGITDRTISLVGIHSDVVREIKDRRRAFQELYQRWKNGEELTMDDLKRLEDYTQSTNH